MKDVKELYFRWGTNERARTPALVGAAIVGTETKTDRGGGGGGGARNGRGQIRRNAMVRKRGRRRRVRSGWIIKVERR